MNESIIKVIPTTVDISPSALPNGGVVMTTTDRIVRKESAQEPFNLAIEVHDRKKKKSLKRNIAGWIATGALAIASATPIFVASEALRGDANVTTPQAELIEETVFVASLAVGIPAWRRMRRYDHEIDRLELQEKKLRSYVIEHGDVPRPVKVVGPIASE
jgi:hypothetical protein